MLRNLHLIFICVTLLFAFSCQPSDTVQNPTPNPEDDEEEQIQPPTPEPEQPTPEPEPPISQQVTINPQLSFADIKPFLLEGESYSLYDDYILRVNIYFENNEDGESLLFSKYYTDFEEIFSQGELAFWDVEIDDDDFQVFVWCDFLTNERAQEFYSWDNYLEEVFYTDAFWTAPSEAKDAFQGFALRREGEEDLTIYLARPLSKFSLVTNDHIQFLKNEGEEDLSKFEFELKYHSKIPFAYNLHEQISVLSSFEIPQNIPLNPQIINDNLRLAVQSLFYTETVTFDLLIYKNKQLIRTYENIFVKLSEGETATVQGDFLTSSSGIGIDTEFDGVTDVWID